MYYFLQIFICFVYIEQIFSNYVVLDDEIINYNVNVKGYVIVNLIYNISLLLYLCLRMIIHYKNKLKYDNDYFSYYDFWFFSLGFVMYFFASTYFYSVMFEKEDRKILMDNESFKIFLYSHIPIGSIFFTIVFLFLVTIIIFFLGILINCCLDCDNESKVFPV